MCWSVHCLQWVQPYWPDMHSKQYCPPDYTDAIKCSFSLTYRQVHAQTAGEPHQVYLQGQKGVGDSQKDQITASERTDWDWAADRTATWKTSVGMNQPLNFPAPRGEFPHSGWRLSDCYNQWLLHVPPPQTGQPLTKTLTADGKIKMDGFTGWLR